MINEERARMMARLALFEKKHCRKELQITKYFNGDYVEAQMLWSFICGTLAFAIIAGVAALYNIENLMLELFSMDIIVFARNILIAYIIFMAVYLSFCYMYLSFRYNTYKKRVSRYLLRLKDLYRHYVQHNN